MPMVTIIWQVDIKSYNLTQTFKPQITIKYKHIIFKLYIILSKIIMS